MYIGFPTNLLKGYLTSTKNLCSIVQPDHVFHFFDEGRLSSLLLSHLSEQDLLEITCNDIYIYINQ